MRQGLVVALVIVAAGCGQPLPSQPSSSPVPVTSGPTRICAEPFRDVPQPVSCTEAIGQVLLRLGPDARFVHAAWFNRGLPCPPNARCIAPPAGSAYVVVRFEGGRVSVVPVTFVDAGISVGAPEDPTYDIWPRSGEGGPRLGAPDLGIEAPQEVTGRPELPYCGDERGELDSAARRCFFTAVLDGRPAEFVSRNNDNTPITPAFEIYGYSGRGPVVVYRNGEGGTSARWTREDCAIAPVGDEDTIFVTQECLVIQLP
ncbi:MAG TPA: hypothetical protein VGQ58_02090 [Candidatus Limnocylindrales bacterium]|jgi:hypothetical protein|nr:hypothetical protein [Candidatus Limnocylindrales bacterium]